MLWVWVITGQARLLHCGVAVQILTLMVIPAIYLIWRRWQVARRPDLAIEGALRDQMALAPKE